MLFSVPWFLYLIAFILVLVNGLSNRVPLWIAVLLIAIGLLVPVKV